MQRPDAERLLFDLPKWSTGHWKIPFALTVGVHFLAFLLLLVSPYLHQRRPLLDVQTVNLFTAQEIELPKPPKAAPAPAPAPPPPVTKIETPAPPPVSVAPEPAPAAPQQAISLKPLKKKEKISSPEEEIKAKQTILERKLRQVQARIDQQQAEATVKKEVETALDRIRQSLATRPSATSSSTSSEEQEVAAPVATGSDSSGSVQVSEAKKRYYAAIQMHLGKYWTLPESHDWKENLEVIAVLWFRADGTIVKRTFEKKSANDFFNRFVQLTLEKVDRVPPIPLDMPTAESRLIVEEGLGFRFHPSGIY